MKKEEFSNLSIEYHKFGSNLLAGALLLLRVSLLTGIALLLSASEEVFIWLIGQFLFSIAVFQWFVLLHDFGHNNFFKSTVANWIWGHIASLFCLVPYTPWKFIHTKHHVWTGWHDKDPTMESTLPKMRPELQLRIARFTWKYWIPLLILAFSFKNFWNVPRLFRLFPKKNDHLQFLFSISLLIVAFTLSVIYIPKFFIFWSLGYFLFLFWSEPILISQHTHIPQKISAGQEVRPIPVYEQEIYTRALRFPPFISKFILLKFDFHIAHHIWPSIPCYYLDRVKAPATNSFIWWTWLKAVKGLPGDQILFSNREVTKWEI